MLLLVSSSATRRYADDIVRALAYPDGSEFQFRYGEQYLDPSSLTWARKGDISGESALICYLSRGTSNPVILVPCRFVTIVSCVQMGTSFVMRLRAGSYVNNFDDSQLDALLTEQELAKIKTLKSQEDRKNRYYVIKIDAPLSEHPDIPAPDALAMKSFENTTQILRQNEYFGGDSPMAFFAVRELTTERRFRCGSRNAVISKSVNGVHKLNSGSRHILNVYTYSPEGEKNPSESIELIIRSNTSEVRFITSAKSRMDSRYDLHQFEFSIDESFFSLRTGLNIALSMPNTSSPPGLEDRCDVDLKIEIQASWHLLLARALLIAAGASTPAIIGLYAAEKGSFLTACGMFAAALIASLGTLFPSLYKK